MHDVIITKEAPNYRARRSALDIGTSETILVLDFGSQYTQLIARRVRELGVYCEIHPLQRDRRARSAPSSRAAIMLSGGPASVYAEGSPRADRAVFELGVPVLGICYGMQLSRTSSAARSSAPATASTGRADHRRSTPASTLFDGLAAARSSTCG